VRSGEAGEVRVSAGNHGAAVELVEVAVAALDDADRAVGILANFAGGVDAAGEGAAENIAVGAINTGGAGSRDRGDTVGTAGFGGSHGVAEVALRGGVVGGLAGVQQVGDEDGGEDADDGDDDEELNEGEALGALVVLHVFSWVAFRIGIG